MAQKNSLSFIVTALVIAAFILLNLLAGMLTERFYIKADLTEAGLYTIDPQTAGLLANMDEVVDVIVLADESAWLSGPGGVLIAETLRQYSTLSGGLFRVQYVNPDLNFFDGPEYDNNLSKLKEAHGKLEHMGRNDIILLSSRRADIRPATSLYVQGQQGAEGLNADMELTAALLYVLNEQVAKAVFIQGHDEEHAGALRAIFERGGYICETVNLSMEDLPEDTTVVISAAPKKDFLSGEILKLEEYLADGGDAIIFYDFGTLSLPRLDGFLAEWGIEVEPSLICDSRFSLLSQPNLILAGIHSGVLPSLEGADGAPVVISRARPLRALWEGETQGRFSAYPLLSTFSNTSYAIDLRDSERTTIEQEDGDSVGPFHVAYHVRLSSTSGESNRPVQSNLIVTGMGLADDVVLDYFSGTYYNGALFGSLAGDFNPFGQNIYIEPKSLGVTLMPITPGQERAVLIVMVIALPLVILLAGILVYRRRRHK
jgi:hypothetical protein